MNKIKYIIKEIAGGQELTPRQHAIFMWWTLSLTFAVIFAECFELCILMAISFALASNCMGEAPIPKDDSAEL